MTNMSSAQWTFTGDTTPTWEQVIDRYQELDRMHHGAKLLELGHDDNGLPIHLFVIADGSGFTPDSIREAGKNVLWITNGIHPGEPDGIDASLLLAQALLESDQLMGLTVNTAVCIVPVYNVSGALQRSSTSRVNQLGPQQYGFRGNARNLDLNRDFIKADARNTRSLLTGLAYWDPDIYFETHVSNGADHQYVMELLATHKDKLDPALSAFMTGTLVPGLYEWMGRKGLLMCPYFETVGDAPEQGLTGFVDGPRYSSGYNALQGRVAVLAETHMLKPYADRVNATFQLMLATLAVMDQHPREVRNARNEAHARVAGATSFGLNWAIDTAQVERLPWKGFAARHEPSAVTGLPRLRYDRSVPTDTMVPWMDHAVPGVTVTKPKAYIIPQAWPEVIERLRASGVPLEVVTEERWEEVDVQRIVSFNTGQAPYEGRYLHADVVTSARLEGVLVRPGDVIVPLHHRTDRLVMEMLEPAGDDSFFAWGFFDSVLQQKEWFSDYVFEDIAADLLATDPALREELAQRKASDPAFASDAFAQLLFVYQRSPYFEPGFRRYPVYRVPH